MLWVGVDLFFVMSGFLITGVLLNLKKGNGGYFGTFYSRRARRILPPYCALLLAWFLAGNRNIIHDWAYYVFFAANLLVAMRRGRNGALTPLWSLAVEEQFYLLWPLAVYAFRPRMLRWFAFALVAAAPILRGLSTHLAPHYQYIYCLTPFRMDLLAAGALIALVWRENPARLWKLHAPAGRGAALGIALLFGAALIWPEFRARAGSLVFNTVGYSLATATFSCVVVYALTLRQGPMYHILTNPALTYIGTISYMAYLVHQPCLDLLAKNRTVVGNAEALIMTLTLSSLSWRFMERPFMKKRRSAELSRGWVERLRSGASGNDEAPAPAVYATGREAQCASNAR
jgi:peptidoglycan/LPS O-acetylase OafA/YrhL